MPYRPSYNIKKTFFIHIRNFKHTQKKFFVAHWNSKQAQKKFFVTQRNSKQAQKKIFVAQRNSEQAQKKFFMPSWSSYLMEKKFLVLNGKFQTTNSIFPLCIVNKLTAIFKLFAGHRSFCFPIIFWYHTQVLNFTSNLSFHLVL
jgi:hypothetical protein